MNVLAIDSSTDLLSVALKTDKGWVEASLDQGQKHAEHLIDLVDFCLSRAGIEPSELDLLACAEGPGSFTGLRIGYATVKGMALALHKDWVAVPTLDCLAWGFESFPGAVVPVIDGKKGRVYSAIYERGGRRGEWLDISLASLIALLDTYPEVLVTGPDADLLEETAQQRSGIRLDGHVRLPAARGLAVLALRRLKEGGASGPEDSPLYLRPSEAEETARTREAASPPNS
jgi:tRNA threonylcarbamoyladenosine biosynthesis protein TsaB